MRTKKSNLTNFSRTITSESLCLRPDNEKQLIEYMKENSNQSLLARGAGLSYSDSSFNPQGYTVDTSRFNHFIEFNPETGIAVCQGAVSFKDLLVLDPDFIPPVLPGTVHATLAGGIAHDVHGKNNHRAGSLGHHVQWIEILVNNQQIRCSREEHSDLFHATIAGLGLTGVILRVALRLKRASQVVQVHNQRFETLESLTEAMSTHGLNNEYQVAWLDLLSLEPRGVLKVANHCEPFTNKNQTVRTMPKLPFGLIKAWNMKWFNQFYFRQTRATQQVSLIQFNNPLDKINQWTRLYGKKGLMQFQAVFNQDTAVETIRHLLQIIRSMKATPTLAVLKLFIQSGEGLLSFCKPGFTLAIDFIPNQAAKNAMAAMNQYIASQDGRVYLAKDLLLDATQFKTMYPQKSQFASVLAQHQCTTTSQLAQRLGIPT